MRGKARGEVRGGRGKKRGEGEGRKRGEGEGRKRGEEEGKVKGEKVDEGKGERRERYLQLTSPSNVLRSTVTMI